MDDLDRLFHELVDTMRRERPAALMKPVTVFELHEQLVPYRRVRNAVGFGSNDDYEAALSRLLSGERGYLLVDGDMQNELRGGLEEVVPDIRRFRSYLEARVSLNPAEIPPPGDIRYAPPEVRERAARAPEVVDSGELTPESEGEDSSAEGLTEPRPANGSPGPSPNEGEVGRGQEDWESVSMAAAAVELCHRCGAELPEQAAYCPFCGSRASVGACKACGAEMEPAWRFCADCGAPREGTSGN